MRVRPDPVDAVRRSSRCATRSARGRWALAAVILGSGAAFLESSVVTVALPAIGRDLDLEFGGLQWVMNAYLLTLSALIITGGSLGDLYGRRIVFVSGLIGFAATSLLCGLAPSGEVLIAARLLQGVAAALLVPASLAIVEASFAEEDRGRGDRRVVGMVGHLEPDRPLPRRLARRPASWRWVFVIVVVVALVAAWLGIRHLPESRATRTARRPSRLDRLGARSASGSPGSPTRSSRPAGAGSATLLSPRRGAVGCLLLIAFLLFERRHRQPMLPLAIFRSRQFSGANAATLANYLAIGAMFFFLSLQLQDVLGYSAARRRRGLVSRHGDHAAVLRAGGRARPADRPADPDDRRPARTRRRHGLLAGIERGDDYLEAILPGVIVFGIGMTIFVAPLTARCSARCPTSARASPRRSTTRPRAWPSCFASAALPAAAGLSATTAVGPGAFSDGYRTAMLIAAAIAALGGLSPGRRSAAAGQAHASPPEPHPGLHLVPSGSRASRRRCVYC